MSPHAHWFRAGKALSSYVQILLVLVRKARSSTARVAAHLLVYIRVTASITSVGGTTPLVLAVPAPAREKPFTDCY